MKKMITRRNFLKAAGVSAAALGLAACGGSGSSTAASSTAGSAAASAAASDWTWERKVTLVCPWGVGGGADGTLRPLQPVLEPILSVPVEIVNVEGAGGANGIDFTCKQPADGYTYVLGTQSHKKGDKVSGQIKSITDFGVFIGLPGGIDGLVHLSDLSWNESGEEAVRKYKKGDELEAVVLAIDTERERISLGIKQMGGDPFSNFASTHDKNTLVKGTVKSVDAKGAVIDLGNEVEGYLRAAEISADRVDDATTRLSAGDEIEALITNIDRKNRSIQLSIRAKDAAEARDALDRLNADATAATGTTNLGALLKAKLEQK